MNGIIILDVRVRSQVEGRFVALISFFFFLLLFEIVFSSFDIV